MIIFEISGWITIKFYLKHRLDRGKAALGFGADRFRRLVSMATDDSHNVTMGKTMLPCLKFGQIRPPTAELAALEYLKKFP